MVKVIQFKSFDCWNTHITQINDISHPDDVDCLEVVLFRKFLNLCTLHEITRDNLVDFIATLNQYNEFFNMNEQRDVHEAFNLMLEIFNMVCRKPKFGSDFSDIPEFTDYYFCGIFKKKFTCTSCHEDNTFFENFRSFIIQPSEDIATFLGKQHVEQKLLTCEKCHLQNLQNVSTKIQEFPRILMLQIIRFSTSSIHSRHRKNNYSMSVYDKVRFGFVG